MSNHWFKRKRYGWGWVPITWQGWLTIVIYLVLVLLGSLFLGRNETAPDTKNHLVFWTVTVVATGLLFVVTYYTAPKPRWRWGKKPDDNPKEDF